MYNSHNYYVNDTMFVPAYDWQPHGLSSLFPTQS